MADDLATALQALVGEQLSSVTFVTDYWQLAFDGHGVSIMSRLVVTGPDWRVSDGDVEFRNRLCERIGHLVTGAALRPGDCLALSFEKGITIEASVRERDYRGPEAIHFHRRGSPGFDYVL
jgi:hypothetical protein